MLESGARAMPRAFVLGAAAMRRTVDGNIAMPVSCSCMQHCLNASCACVRIARAVPPQLQRRGRPCAGSESDVGCRATGATSAMWDTLTFAWCCVLRELPVLCVAGASSSPLWTPSRCGWRDCDAAAGTLPVTRTVRPLPSPKHPISVRRDGGGCVRVCGTAS